MNLIFDKGLTTEVSVVVHNYYENITGASATLNAVYSTTVNAQTQFRDYSNLEGLTFTTVDLVNSDGVSLPKNHAYTSVDVVNISYADDVKMYSVNISLK